MKKIIIAIILFICLALPASAFYYNNPLVTVWNSRPDLQRAFPGDPSNNAKLESWAKNYGWKENVDLFSYYPDKAVVEKIIDNKTNDRITALEQQVAALTNKVNQLQSAPVGQSTTIIQQTETDGIWRDCFIGDTGNVSCKTNNADWPAFNNGRFYIKFLTN